VHTSSRSGRILTSETKTKRQRENTGVFQRPVSVALSQEQYQWLKSAIENWKGLQEKLREMQKLSRQVLFATIPNPPRRKRLGKKVLGLI
jgi:hypothetical protein